MRRWGKAVSWSGMMEQGIFQNGKMIGSQLGAIDRNHLVNYMDMRLDHKGCDIEQLNELVW